MTIGVTAPILEASRAKITVENVSAIRGCYRIRLHPSREPRKVALIVQLSLHRVGQLIASRISARSVAIAITDAIECFDLRNIMIYMSKFPA
jgi:hypothetical protein